MKLSAELPEPACPPGEAIIRPTRLLISPADLCAAGLISGSPETRPFQGVLGSQFVGIIKKINLPADAGPLLAARKSWVGRRIVGCPTHSCGSCDLCRHGLAIHCRARRVMGVFERDGCFADAFAAPLLSLSQVGDSVSDDKAVFAHVLSGALHAVNMLRGQHASFITVLGDGVLALLTAQALARMNKTVRVLSSHPERQKLCEKSTAPAPAQASAWPCNSSAPAASSCSRAHSASRPSRRASPSPRSPPAPRGARPSTLRRPS
jgi:threonine dehydrogenase-like Zn-dependent dehydrogenase